MKVISKRGLFVTFMVLFLCTGALADVQEGSFWYALDNLTSAEKDAQAIIWVTLPAQWHGQDVEITSIVPEPVAILEDQVTGNRVIEWVYRPGEDSLPMNRFFHFDFTWQQKAVAVDVDPAKIKGYDRDSAEYAQYTRPEIWIQTDGRILDVARNIIGSEKNPWLQTRALFVWCMENLTAVPSGSGDKDAISTLATRKGDCGQFGRLMVAFCRSIGIPARTVTNAWLSGGTHVFVEVMMPGYGWVPSDSFLAQMLQPERAGLSQEELQSFMDEKGVPLGDPYWFLGNLFSGRVITAVGNNITIDSPTLGKKITFQSMRPGGDRSHPKAFSIDGFNRDLIHGGFFVFGEKVESEEDAHMLTHMRLANSYFNVGLYDVGEECCLQSLNQYSDGVQPWINMGKVYMHKGQYYKAEAAFLRALRGAAARPKEKLEAMVWTHNYLGNCYDLLNHRDMALEQYQLVVDMGNNYRGAVEYARKYLEKPFQKEGK